MSCRKPSCGVYKQHKTTGFASAGATVLLDNFQRVFAVLPRPSTGPGRRQGVAARWRAHRNRACTGTSCRTVVCVSCLRSTCFVCSLGVFSFLFFFPVPPKQKYNNNFPPCDLQCSRHRVPPLTKFDLKSLLRCRVCLSARVVLYVPSRAVQ